jgi:ABC-type lipoprotein release transport system permease subunit
MRTWIEKQKCLIDFTISSLLRRKGRNLCLLAVYTSIVFLLASVMLFTHALRKNAAEALAQSPEMTVQHMVAGRNDPVRAEWVDQVRSVRGVQKAEGRLWGYYYDPDANANFTFLVPAADAGFDLQPGKVVVGASVSRHLAAPVGANIVFESYTGKLTPFKVSGVIPGEADLLTADVVLLREEDFRSFFDYPAGQFTDIALSVANPRELRTIAAKVAARLPGARTVLREDVLRTYDSIFHWREGIVLVLLAGAVIAFAIFALEKASGLSADERREIGILKAIGWETGDVLRMKFWEGGLISLSAFLLGYVLAYLHVFRFSAGLFEPVLRGWSILYPRLALVPAIDGFQVATLFCFTVLPYSLATVVPIWRAAITDPDSVMRG